MPNSVHGKACAPACPPSVLAIAHRDANTPIKRCSTGLSRLAAVRRPQYRVGTLTVYAEQLGDDSRGTLIQTRIPLFGGSAAVLNRQEQPDDSDEFPGIIL
jgi:hypothetical protein